MNCQGVYYGGQDKDCFHSTDTPILILLFGLAIISMPLAHPYLQKTPVHPKITSPYRIELIYGAMPP